MGEPASRGFQGLGSHCWVAEEQEQWQSRGWGIFWPESL